MKKITYTLIILFTTILSYAQSSFNTKTMKLSSDDSNVEISFVKALYNSSKSFHNVEYDLYIVPIGNKYHLLNGSGNLLMRSISTINSKNITFVPKGTSNIVGILSLNFNYPKNQ